jgi:Mrp family chromosome partitioning ATPase
MADQIVVLDAHRPGVAADEAAMTNDRFPRPEPGRSRVPVFGYHRQAGQTGQAPRDNVMHLPVATALVPARMDPARVWDGLSPVMPDAAHLAAGRLIPAHSNDPVGVLFDVLRTRLLQALETNGWTRVAVTSPRGGCGKSFVAANLALALARKPSCRSVLLDLELRRPALARMFGIEEAGSMAAFLSGARPLEQHLVRLGRNLALGLGDPPAADAGTLLHEPCTADTLAALADRLKPDVVLCDLPPVLAGDDTIGFLPQVDGVLLVTDGRSTLPEEVRACERLFEGRVPLLGVVLNRADPTANDRHGHDDRAV